MMTQLKSYLLQSAELQAMLEPQHQYSQDKLGNCLTDYVLFHCFNLIIQVLYRSHYIWGIFCPLYILLIYIVLLSL